MFGNEFALENRTDPSSPYLDLNPAMFGTLKLLKPWNLPWNPWVAWRRWNHVLGDLIQAPLYLLFIKVGDELAVVLHLGEPQTNQN